MNRLLAASMTLLLLAAWSLSAQALRYGASMHQAQWQLKASPFECRLWQPIPSFGDAVFSNRAGEDQAFYLAPIKSPMKAGKAKLASIAPVWDESRTSIEMGLVNVSAKPIPIVLGKRLAVQLMHELYKGMSPEFSRVSWYAKDEAIQLSLSSVSFRKVYHQYRDCLVDLLPVNFEQINRSRIQFLSSNDQLTAQSKGQLDNVVSYIKADSTVTSFYIDGHTDSAGRRLDNLDLSKRRAEAVTKYLIAKGVDEASITTRYHGERYPVVNNSNARNRYKNRRVTLRLERE